MREAGSVALPASDGPNSDFTPESEALAEISELLERHARDRRWRASGGRAFGVVVAGFVAIGVLLAVGADNTSAVEWVLTVPVFAIAGAVVWFRLSSLIE